ncbi:unnamed protein product [Ostreobium quekettii]|uniref:Protein kinase domain-containing protein n=1 Tax=Ostreobium quekettii TaxID=121088 RepID=A0A8S1J0X7_9CHLO|nr:unnamed protein product [Ostreobium quekettii]
MQAWRIIDDDEVVLGGVLCRDDWNVVHKAQWDDELVAVRSRRLRMGHKEQQLVCFIREAAVHASIAHPNVVHLYGITRVLQVDHGTGRRQPVANVSRKIPGMACQAVAPPASVCRIDISALPGRACCAWLCQQSQLCNLWH